MHVTRLDAAKSYEAKRHHAMHALRLHGHEASDCKDFWVGLSTFLPGGGAEWAAAPSAKVYVVIDGEITITTEDGDTTLGPLDSCCLMPNEQRSVENRTNRPTTMLVVSPY